MQNVTNQLSPARKTHRDAAVEVAWGRALAMLPTLTLLGNAKSSLRKVMEEAVDAALDLGVIEPEELVDAAISRVPKLRSPDGRGPQFGSDHASSKMTSGN